MGRRVPNELTPLKRDCDRKVPKFSVFDIESNRWKEFVVCGHYDGETYQDYGSILEFLYDVSEKPGNRTIFAHNGGGFDFNFILEAVIRGDGREDFYVDEMLPRGNSLLCMTIVRKKNDRDFCKIQFRDSLAMLPFSLKSLTENFQTACAKGEWDHSVEKYRNDPKLLEYLRDDCVGLYQVLEKYFQWPLVQQCGVSFTIASQALKIFRSTLKEKIPGCPTESPVDDFNVDKFVRRAYFGGRTEVFRPYYKAKPGEKLSCFDVNSLYPSVMMDFEYPTKFLRWETKYDPKKMSFWEATVEVPKDCYVPPLGGLFHIDKKTKQVRSVTDSSQGKFLFPTGIFSGVWSNVELEYAKSVGVKVISYGKGAIFENGGKIFERYVSELYEMRMRAGKDSVDSFICKLLLNSLYGRFGLNLDRVGLERDYGQCGVELTGYSFETGELEQGIPVIERYVSVPKRIESFTNVAIAAWVTSQARIRMHKHYMKYQDRIYYTDTDSVFIVDRGDLESSKKLGEFKYEYSATEACFLLPKTYALAGITGLKNLKGEQIKTKAVLKGITKEAIKTRNPQVGDFLELLEGDVRRLHKIPLALEFVIKEKFSKLKTAMRKGTFLDVTEQSKKKVKAKYDKREIFLNGDDYETRPIHIENGLALNYRDADIKVTAERGKKRKVTLEEQNEAAAMG